MKDKYIVDTNILITAHRLHYPFDIFPSFWKQLIEKVGKKIVIIEEVEKELHGGSEGDLLTKWYDENKNVLTVFNIPEKVVTDSYSEISNMLIKNRKFINSAKEEFLSIADSWICAYGLAYGSTIVTHETYDGNMVKKIKIPNICEKFDIRYISMLDFMREVGMKI